MTNKTIRLSTCVVSVLAIVLVATALSWWFLESRNTWPRGQALADALRPVIDEQDTNRAIVAKAILTNYLEVRANASRWSSVYWGCTFVAALFSALAGLILKLESLPIGEKPRKDVAATLAVAAAILVTISTSGDFQRKWQANRIAAAEIERTGYTFLEMDGTNARSFLSAVGKTLHQRHLAIVGGTDRNAISSSQVQDPSTTQ